MNSTTYLALRKIAANKFDRWMEDVRSEAEKLPVVGGLFKVDAPEVENDGFSTLDDLRRYQRSTGIRPTRSLNRAIFGKAGVEADKKYAELRKIVDRQRKDMGVSSRIYPGTKEGHTLEDYENFYARHQIDPWQYKRILSHHWWNNNGPAAMAMLRTWGSPVDGPKKFMRNENPFMQ